MDLAGLFSQYGYLMLLFGSLGEGAPIMVFGGFAAHRGWLSLVPWVILIGAIGNAAAQIVWFFSARYAGRKILEKKAGWSAKVEKADRLLARWEAPVVLGARFIPGFNTTAIIALALSAMPPRKFLVLNAIGAIVWAVAFGILGYALGQAVERYIGDIEHYEKPIAVVLVVAGLAFVVWRYARAFGSAKGKTV